MKKIPCNVIRDLMPSYIDKICSEESKTLVEKHLEECSECKDYFNRISGNNDALTWREEKDMDYLKKVRKTLDIKALILMTFIIIVTVAFANYNMRYVNSPVVFYVLTPLVMLCNYFMFFNLRAPAQQGSKSTAYIMGAIDIAIGGYIVLLMRVLLFDWIANYQAGKTLPFGLPLEQLGPFTNCQLLIGMFIAVIIWCITIFKHIKGQKFYTMVSCLSILIVYFCFFFRHILKTLDDLNDYGRICNQAYLLLIEGAVVLAVIKLIDYYRIQHAK